VRGKETKIVEESLRVSCNEKERKRGIERERDRHGHAWSKSRYRSRF
jgi:hypothetical protein